MEIAKEIVDQIQKSDNGNSVKCSTVEIRNKVEIVGTIDTEIEVAYKIHEEVIYKFVLKVPRLRKDVFDYLNVEIPERGMNLSNFGVGDKVKLVGQFRSSNRKDDGEDKSHLYLNIFAESIESETTNSKINEVKLHGHICREPHFRVTPNGREICDLLLAVNRNYNRCDYIPCITWGRDAKFAKEFQTGQGFYIVGRLQSRNYRKRIDDNEVVERTAYEVSVSEIRETEEGEVITETRYVS